MSAEQFTWLRAWLLVIAALAILPVSARTQEQSTEEQIRELRELVLHLQARVAALERQNGELGNQSSADSAGGPDAAIALASATADLRQAGSSQPAVLQTDAAAQPTLSAGPSILPASLPGGATMNYLLDGYYEYNFNNPPGRANNLRVYDVLSNVFSLSQADFIFDLDPDISAHRRYGFRVDFQFAQATETLQGNPANEP